MFFSIHTQRAERPKPAIFLDRDGTINVEKNYLYKIEDWEWIPGAEEAIKQFKQADYLVVVVSNQAGIARGKYGPEKVNRLHLWVQADLAQIDMGIDAFYYCPHHPEFTGQCPCRKPAPGMLLAAAAALNIDLGRSWIVGDKSADMLAGNAAGMQRLLVRTGYGVTEERRIGRVVPVIDSLQQAPNLLRRCARRNRAK